MYVVGRRWCRLVDGMANEMLNQLHESTQTNHRHPHSTTAIGGMSN